MDKSDRAIISSCVILLFNLFDPLSFTKSESSATEVELPSQSQTLSHQSEEIRSVLICINHPDFYFSFVPLGLGSRRRILISEKTKKKVIRKPGFRLTLR